MIIVIPMAGLSSRFKQSGYNEPKYMLSLWDKSVFYYAIHSFKAYFNKEKILFVCRDICNTKVFIDNECKKLGLQFYETITLEKETMGQAHTTLLGLEKSETKDTESLLIFNIDTFRPNFSLPITTDFSEIDGYLEVFHAEGNEWSFVLPDKNSNRVLKTSEKDRISSLCSSGLYYFKRTRDFKEALKFSMQNNITTKNEYYIAPLYNILIEWGMDIRFFTINLSEVVFCGTPRDYERLKQLNKKDIV